MEDAVIREVEPEKAEAVLTVRLHIPGVDEGRDDRYYLARVRPRQFISVVESVICNPNGSITTTGSIRTVGETLVAHCSHADGATARGKGFGYSKTVSIRGRSADEVAVHVSVRWKARDGGRGRLDEELVVPWLGPARADLNGGIWVTADIAPM
ncbi:hypothetical protein J8F10_17425 [Gemmata sp. G18]|uniref:Uncharacterized protein n=1 Tax=Gemmata palustris TaxID=2822762 RepID=A0ABS5BTK8_9BACT|nr:hypothetical protein [Gemmata palustris]MBP3957051.1 hypothetical protein [Gemmata palustris]